MRAHGGRSFPRLVAVKERGGLRILPRHRYQKHPLKALRKRIWTSTGYRWFDGRDNTLIQHNRIVLRDFQCNLYLHTTVSGPGGFNTGRAKLPLSLLRRSVLGLLVLKSEHRFPHSFLGFPKRAPRGNRKTGEKWLSGSCFALPVSGFKAASGRGSFMCECSASQSGIRGRLTPL